MSDNVNCYIEVNLLDRILNGIKCKSHVFRLNDPKTVINDLQVVTNDFWLVTTKGLKTFKTKFKKILFSSQINVSNKQDALKTILNVFSK